MQRLLLAAAVFVIAGAFSALIVPIARVIAARVGILDHPGERKVHAASTPRTGGIAVAISFITVVLVGYLGVPLVARLPLFSTYLGDALAPLAAAYRVEGKLVATLIGAGVVFVVGFIDDLMGVKFSPVAKALGQIVAALVLIAADIQTSFMPTPWLNTALTVFWVVGITNAFNLLDNMDGLAAGVALVASFVLLCNALALGSYFIALFLLAFMGALAGFLKSNWSPASIFLGDCGSLFIGYTLSALTLLERYVIHADSNYFPILMPVLVLAVPIIDTTTVVVIRLREGRPIYVGDRCHLSHRLVDLGLRPPAAVSILLLATLCLGLGGAALADASPYETLVILLQSLGFVVLFLILLFFDRGRSGRPGTL
jgi:UDP-GlcNAc:undecaprenyl-phosphate GlcNAc-1-phosphate transferase